MEDLLLSSYEASWARTAAGDYCELPTDSPPRPPGRRVPDRHLPQTPVGHLTETVWPDLPASWERTRPP